MRLDTRALIKAGIFSASFFKARAASAFVRTDRFLIPVGSTAATGRPYFIFAETQETATEIARDLGLGAAWYVRRTKSGQFTRGAILIVNRTPDACFLFTTADAFDTARNVGLRAGRNGYLLAYAALSALPLAGNRLGYTLHPLAPRGTGVPGGVVTTLDTEDMRSLAAASARKLQEVHRRRSSEASSRTLVIYSPFRSVRHAPGFSSLLKALPEDARSRLTLVPSPRSIERPRSGPPVKGAMHRTWSDTLGVLTDYRSVYVEDGDLLEMLRPMGVDAKLLPTGLVARLTKLASRTAGERPASHFPDPEGGFRSLKEVVSHLTEDDPVVIAYRYSVQSKDGNRIPADAWKAVLALAASDPDLGGASAREAIDGIVAVVRTIGEGGTPAPLDAVEFLEATGSLFASLFAVDPLCDTLDALSRLGAERRGAGLITKAIQSPLAWSDNALPVVRLARCVERILPGQPEIRREFAAQAGAAGHLDLALEIIAGLPDTALTIPTARTGLESAGTIGNGGVDRYADVLERLMGIAAIGQIIQVCPDAFQTRNPEGRSAAANLLVSAFVERTRGDPAGTLAQLSARDPNDFPATIRTRIGQQAISSFVTLSLSGDDPARLPEAWIPSERRVGYLLRVGDVQGAIQAARSQTLAGRRIPNSEYNALLARFGGLDEERDGIDVHGLIDAGRPDEIMAAADVLILGGDPDVVLEILDGARVRARFVEPEDCAALLTLWLRCSAPALAASYLEGLSPEFQSSPAVARHAAEALHAVGRHDAALDLLSAAAERNPDLDLNLRLAAARARDGDRAAARRALQPLATQQALNTTFLKAWVETLRLTGELDQRLQTLKSYLDRGEVTAAQLLELSCGELERGDLSASAELALEFARRAPGASGPLRHVVSTLHMMAEGAAVRGVIERCERAAGGTVTAFVHLNEMARRIGDAAAALRFARLAFDRDPLSTLAATTLSRQTLENGDVATGLAVARVAADFAPRSVAALNQLGEAQLLAGDPEEALRTVRIANRLARPRGTGLELEGRALAALGRFRDSKQSLESALTLRENQLESPNLRGAWRLTTGAALLRDTATTLRGYGSLVDGLHRAMPADIPFWKGEPLAGKRIVLIARGGPGDEFRTLSSNFGYIYDQAEKIFYVGDGRLEEIFRVNFPRAVFVANPWAGRRLRQSDTPIDPAFAKGLRPGTFEALQRFSAYLPDEIARQADFVAFSDDLVLRSYFERQAEHRVSRFQRQLELPDDHRRAAIAGELCDTRGVTVAISWRGSYFNSYRRQTSFLDAGELGPLFALPGVTFLDTHPTYHEGEIDPLRERFALDYRYPRGFDPMNDFVSLGWLMKSVDAVVTPGVTQRDIAAAVRPSNVWSFSVFEGAGETWRFDPESGEDVWQDAIRHVDVNSVGSREKVVEVLAGWLSGLVRAREIM